MRIWQLLIDLEKKTWFEMNFCISVLITLAHAASNWKSLNHEINLEKKRLTQELLTRKKIRTEQIPTRKILDPRNTHEKKFGPANYPGEKN